MSKIYTNKCKIHDFRKEKLFKQELYIMKKNKKVLLIGFYNEKALGVRYLANALKKNGYRPYILLFKGFNSVVPSKATEKELSLLKQLVEKIDPLFIGLSVMSSLYLETTYMVNDIIKKNFDVPIAWGGVFATLMPEKAIQYCDFVLRGEGEETIVELAHHIQGDKRYDDIKNLTFINSDGKLVVNDVRPLEQNLDVYGYPTIGGEHMFLIHDNKITKGDPQVHSFTYELNASRGCPFRCSYCSAINLHRVYNGKGRYIRFRSVESVMQELNEAKAKIPKLRVVHFWDEIFSDEENWVEEFCRRYKKEINIPFRIWGHPLKVNRKLISQLVDAGLYQVVMGIQSGSERIRKDVFHRPESQEQIIESAKILSECHVPKVYYDFMICHPFESLEDLKQTFYMCMKLAPPFQLNIHGLNFLPATDIVDMAIEQNIYTKEELDSMMFSSIQDQYDRHWGPNASSYSKASAGNPWVALIYLSQFRSIRKQVIHLAKLAERGQGTKEIFALKKKMEILYNVKDFTDKVKLVLKIKK